MHSFARRPASFVSNFFHSCFSAFQTETPYKYTGHKRMSAHRRDVETPYSLQAKFCKSPEESTQSDQSMQADCIIG